MSNNVLTLYPRAGIRLVNMFGSQRAKRDLVAKQAAYVSPEALGNTDAIKGLLQAAGDRAAAAGATRVRNACRMSASMCECRKIAESDACAGLQLAWCVVCAGKMSLHVVVRLWIACLTWEQSQCACSRIACCNSNSLRGCKRKQACCSHKWLELEGCLAASCQAAPEC